ncbi:rod shape-determining protein RodA [Wohlfahrtiimonas chitiniclastica]|uniref:rod shape-determining protein RodA n=1 Tax=Wohlfahrtiimonas chitiniclastica TaxID=400946 RepID=UPI000B98BF80|nr:rod shape-determining protein RodA [Wohlfahrtiimonas chitiniclastica]OYQ87875.1 rod shape-determining protein RodA [Wohlfahrtiimonas chitiniclastica]
MQHFDAHLAPRPKGLLALFHLDTTLFLLLLTVCACGLAILYSASGSNFNIVQAQALRMIIGIIAMMIIAFIPPHVIKSLTPYFFGITLIALALIYVVGVEVNGSHRWLDLKVVRFQPSEFAKLAAPMMVAYFLSNRSLPPSFINIILALIITLMPFALVLRQPDLGTALLILFACITVIFFSGLLWRYIIATLVIVGSALPFVWEFGLQTYQKSRILTLLNPESDPLGKGYQIIQSKIAIGSGGMYGKGWLNSTQASLKFLPESSTDFIYAITAEEFGFVGIAFLLSLYFMIILRAFYLVNRSTTPFNKLIGGSITACFFFYIFVNAGMVSGLLPIVGVPLPFISYGGTSIVTLFISFGIIMSIFAHPEPKKEKEYTT